MGRKHYQQIMSAAEKRNPSNQIIDRNYEQIIVRWGENIHITGGRFCKVTGQRRYIEWAGHQVSYIFNKSFAVDCISKGKTWKKNEVSIFALKIWSTYLQLSFCCPKGYTPHDLWCYQHEENRKKSNSYKEEKQIKTGNIQTQLQQRSP